MRMGGTENGTAHTQFQVKGSASVAGLPQ